MKTGEYFYLLYSSPHGYKIEHHPYRPPVTTEDSSILGPFRLFSEAQNHALDMLYGDKRDIEYAILDVKIQKMRDAVKEYKWERDPKCFP